MRGSAVNVNVSLQLKDFDAEPPVWSVVFHSAEAPTVASPTKGTAPVTEAEIPA